MLKNILLSALCMLQFSSLFGQTPEVKKFAPATYQGGYQTWDMIQDKSGIMYISDNFGIFQYDGKYWKKYLLKDKDIAFGLAIHDDTLFVGSNEIGYLGYDSTKASRQFFSLTDRIPKVHRKIKTIRKINQLKDGLVFRDWYDKLLFYQNKQFTYVDAYDSTHYLKSELPKGLTKKTPRRILYFNHNIHVLIKNTLFAWNGKSFSKSTKLDQLTNLVNLSRIIDYRQDTLLALDAKNNQLNWIYTKAGKAVGQAIYKTALDSTFAKEKANQTIYYIRVLHNGLVALTIKYKGLYILDKAGNIVRHVLPQQDVPTRLIYNFKEDNEGNIWTLGEKGVGQIYNNSAVTYWDKRHGFEGHILSFTHYQNKLYVGSMQGVFYKQSNEHFVKLKGANNEAWRFLKHQGKLYTAQGDGVYEIQGNEMKKLVSQQYVQTLSAIRGHSNKFLLGTYNAGIYLVENNNGKWTKQKIKGNNPKDNVFDLREDKDGSFWIYNLNKGIFRVWFNEAKDSITKKILYTKKDGLPENTDNYAYPLQSGELVFCTLHGAYTFDKNTQRFKPHPTLYKHLNHETFLLYETPTGKIFAQVKNKGKLQMVLLQKTNNGYETNHQAFKNVKPSLESISAIWLPSERLVIAKNGQMVVYDPRWQSKGNRQYNTIIRKVLSNDSLLFTHNNLQEITLTYQNNTLRFEYASLAYEASEKNLFQFRLDGFQEHWSKWNTEQNTNFTNLPEGTYTFRVRAKNVYGIIGKEATFRFKILAPWYRTWWMYAVYISLGVLLVWLAIYLNSRRLVRQKEVLENKVKERTIELQQKQEEITAQHEELQQQHEEITTQRDFIEEKNQQLFQKNLQVKKSIEAAKIIQDAILPFDDRMQRIFKNYFVLFRPRDIVSGDFYWADASKTDPNIKLMAAIDCTGHGVPGAFMSMISYTLLNEIVHQHKITQPAQVLENLRKELRHALKREKTGNQSGMDVALCNIQYQSDDSVKIVFAGAKRPMFYFDTTAQTFNEIKGSRISIGVIPRGDQFFEEHELVLHKGDLIFLTTDGYGDQNNAARKSFGSHKLKKLLASNAQLPLAEQQQILEQQLDDYMVNTTQRDDILIVGIKL